MFDSLKIISAISFIIFNRHPYLLERYTTVHNNRGLIIGDQRHWSTLNCYRSFIFHLMKMIYNFKKEIFYL